MRLLSALSKLLMSLAVAALVIGGAAPATAVTMVGSAAVMVMPDGMPPREDMAPDCGDMTNSCPLQTVCAAKCPQATLAVASILVPLIPWVGDVPGDLPGAGSLAHAPPARPPKA